MTNQFDENQLEALSCWPCWLWHLLPCHSCRSCSCHRHHSHRYRSQFAETVPECPKIEKKTTCNTSLETVRNHHGNCKDCLAKETLTQTTATTTTTTNNNQQQWQQQPTTTTTTTNTNQPPTINQLQQANHPQNQHSERKTTPTTSAHQELNFSFSRAQHPYHLHAPSRSRRFRNPSKNTPLTVGSRFRNVWSLIETMVKRVIQNRTKRGHQSWPIGSIYGYTVYLPGDSMLTFLGMVKTWPFRGLGELQLGDEKR